MDIEFFSSRSRHTLFIEQDGNWIQGSHQGDFTARDLVGMIEGNEVTLRSVERRPGSSVTFIFSGTVVGRHHLGPDSHGRVPQREVHREEAQLSDGTHADRRAEGTAAGDMTTSGDPTKGYIYWTDDIGGGMAPVCRVKI